MYRAHTKKLNNTLKELGADEEVQMDREGGERKGKA
jgi:hypothetical protein